MTNDPTAASATAERAAVVRFRERIADVVAAIFLVSGTALFLFARQSLTSLANGTYKVSAGLSNVARADLHATQSRIGLSLAAFGLALAIGAAMSHSHALRHPRVVH